MTDQKAPSNPALPLQSLGDVYFCGGILKPYIAAPKSLDWESLYKASALAPKPSDMEREIQPTAQDEWTVCGGIQKPYVVSYESLDWESLD